MKRALLVTLLCLTSTWGLAEDRGESKKEMALKNRASAPASSAIDGNVSITALLEKSAESDWSSTRGATIEGFVMQVEREEDGDAHVVLAPSADDTDSKRWVIVEVPLSWRKKLGTSVDKLRALTGKKVRATGWLYYEPDEGEHDPRGTRWELHPVTSIEAVR